MIQVGITALLVWCFFRLLDKEGQVDLFSSLALVAVPAFTVFLLGMAVVSFEWSQWLVLIFQLSYFLIPLLLMKIMTDYKWPKITGFAAAVFFINIFTQGIMYATFV